MYQIDNSTAAATIPASTSAGSPGFFTDGNPATGVPATIMPAEFMNMLMMEIMNVLGAAGVTPSKSNFTQLLTAIRAVGRQSTILTDTGTAGIYTAANTPALSSLPASGYIQRVNIVNPNPGASTYSPDGLTAKPIYGLALQPLQGGELPAGVAIMMYLVQAGVNGGNGAWILIESLGGASQVAQATKTQHALPLGQAQSFFSTVVGSSRNAKMSIPTAAATATFTADEVVVRSAAGQTYLLRGVSVAVNLANTGVGGMDTGSAPVNGYVAKYVIYNPLLALSGTNPALLAVNATSTVAPELCAGALPSGYTASALVSVVPTNGSSQFKAGFLKGRIWTFVGVTALSTSTIAGSLTSLSIATIVPPNAIAFLPSPIIASSSANVVMIATVASSSAGIGEQAMSGSISAGGGGFQQPFPFVSIITQQTAFYKATVAAGTMSYLLVISGYEF